MMKTHNKIHNIESLLREKRHLKAIVHEKESELKLQVAFFEKYYGAIIWDKINPFKGTGILSSGVKYLTNDLLPLIADIDDKKEHSVISMLLAKGIKGTVLNKGLKFVKKLIVDTDSEIEKMNETENSQVKDGPQV